MMKQGDAEKMQGMSGFSLLDGASSQAPIIAPELETQKKLAADSDEPLGERLEAYEDIIDSEVGDTTLSRARNIEREVGLRQIYLKFEGANPTGTQKDRIAFAQAKDAMRRGFDAITLATCGNYGVAMSLAASMAGLRCVTFIPQEYHTKRVKEMADYGAEIIRTILPSSSRPMARSPMRFMTIFAMPQPRSPFQYRTAQRWQGYTRDF
jgi:threonine synthase